MIYDIIYKEEDQMYHMNGNAKMFVGEHLETIGRELNIMRDLDDCLSESHMLAVLESKGIIVNLLEEDGSRMDW